MKYENLYEAITNLYELMIELRYHRDLTDNPIKPFDDFFHHNEGCDIVQQIMILMEETLEKLKKE